MKTNKENGAAAGVIYITITVLLVCFTVCLIAYTINEMINVSKEEAQTWNNGICSICHKEYHLEKVEDSSIEKYVFVCDNHHYIKLGYIPESQSNIWNNGICPKCENKWRYRQEISDGWKTKYIFECQKGHTTLLDELS